MNDSVSYGIICVKLLNPLADLTMAEDLLIAYSDYLKSSFSITKAIGYGKGHRLPFRVSGPARQPGRPISGPSAPERSWWRGSRG